MSVNFTAQDAQNLVSIAQLAPLKNLQEAQHLSDLLTRFAAWANTMLGTQAPGPAPIPPLGDAANASTRAHQLAKTGSAAPSAAAPSPSAVAVRRAINASKPAPPRVVAKKPVTK